MPSPQRVTNVLVGAGAAVFIVANTVNALNKGGDFLVFLEGGRLFLDGKPLYADSAVGGGFIGPPFQAVLFAPFALLAFDGTVVPRLAWYATNLLALAFGIACWTVALAPGLDVQARTGWHTINWRRVLVPLLAVIFPLQTNFEHQNLNAVLLALTGGAALLLERSRDAGAGMLVGCAAAVKAYPGFLCVYLIAARRWTAASVAIAAALVLTAVPAVRYGALAYAGLVQGWLDLSTRGGWPVRGNNQSLFAMLARYSGADAVSAAAAWVYPVWLALGTALSLLLVAAVVRYRPRASVGVAAALGLAVVLSPIAWDHYWILFFPSLYAIYNAPAEVPRWIRLVFWPAALLISGFSRVTVGADGLSVARDLSTSTIAGIGLVAAMLTMIATLSARRQDAGSPNARESGG
jgi:alpha-1,2-mannosyltransferase